VTWFLLALISTAFLAATAVSDKLILSRYMQTSTAYLVSLILIQQIFAIAIFAKVGADFVYPDSIMAMVAGFIQIAFWIVYLRAMQVEEVSRVTAMGFIYPLFVFLAAAYLLGESLSLRNYLGGVLIMVSAVLLSYKKTETKGSLVLSPAMKYILIFWAFSTLYAISIKYILTFMDEWHLFAWSSIGSLIIALLLMADRGIRDGALGIFNRGPLILGVILSEELFDFLGRIFLILAYAQGPASLVSSVGALQPMIVLLLVATLSASIPLAIQEEFSREALVSKFSAILLVVMGIYLIS
jgi:uncharacterized membrane protein